MKLEAIKESVSSFSDSVAEHLRESAANSLTRFKPSAELKLPVKNSIDDPFYWPSQGWSMLGGEVFEDDQRRHVNSKWRETLCRRKLGRPMVHSVMCIR